MKLLSTRARAQLWKLQDTVRLAAQEREKLWRVLISAREALAEEARRELWLEFSCVDHEYRYAVTRLAQFVERHGHATDSDEPGYDGSVTRP